MHRVSQPSPCALSDQRRPRRHLVVAALAGLLIPAQLGIAQPSVARQWNDALLNAIRRDLARPTVHARNLFHFSVAVWDAWAIYDTTADPFLTRERRTAADILAARNQAISYAAYRFIRARFTSSPGAATTLPALDALMDSLGYDKTYTGTVGTSPAAVGNRVAVNVLAFGLADHANEQGNYGNLHYLPINPPLVPPLPGNPDILDPNRWQPLALDFFIDQAGNVIVGGYPPATTPEWGQVTPFALTVDNLTIYRRDNFDWWVYHDPGPPPLFGNETEAACKAGFERNIEYSSQLDPTNGVMIDISPASRGNNTFGTNDGTGYPANPITGQPYAPQMVPAGDYYRSLVVFWSDGPSSETPPGHWFTVANYVSDHPLVEKRFMGQGPVLDELEWDVKLYLALGGAVHDSAVAGWGVKGAYDTHRPISAIRYMCDLGQCSDQNLPSFHPRGINLRPGLIELVTAETTATGERHEHLAGSEGKIAVFAWRGAPYITDPHADVAGVGWILAENWWPFFPTTFVTPPFPGYVSGHSGFSRTAAEVMTLFTGSPYFPGGMGEFHCPRDTFIPFERGPSVDVTLQWAAYRDASDECSISRIYGGIHPPQDDIPARVMGRVIGPQAFNHARKYFGGASLMGDVNCDESFDADDAAALTAVLTGADTAPCHVLAADLNNDGSVDGNDVAVWLNRL